MPLIHEDGTGLEDAESLISVADADTYHEGVGNAAWAALSTTQKEQALRRATIYMGGMYRDRWAGLRANSDQALDWPRDLVPIRDAPVAFYGGETYVSSTIVPATVANACAELALRATAADLAPDLTRGLKREKVGEIEYEYDTNSPQQTRFRQIELMLRPYLKAGGGSSIVPMSR